MIVVFGSEKGGTGKTTLASNMAVLFAKEGADVVLIDADPQCSSRDFLSVRSKENHSPEISCISISGENAGEEIKKISTSFDDVIVDIGGRDSKTFRSAILVADVLVIPFLPSQYDSWGLERMDDVVGAAKKLAPQLNILAVLNKVDLNPKMSLDQEALSISSSLKNIRLLETKIGYRVSFRKSVSDGLSVIELKTKDKKAIQEISDLYKEIVAFDKEAA